MKELLSLRFPLGKEGMTTVRLATGGVCSQIGLDLDASEDCKVCVTESLLLLLHVGYGRAEITFSEEEGLRAHIAGGDCGKAEPCAEDEISFALLGALASDVWTEEKEGLLTSVTFRFAK